MERKVRNSQRGAPRFPLDPERQRPGPPREFHVSELPPEEQARYQPERPTRADLEAAAAAGRTVEDVAEQFQRPISRVVGLCKHYRLGLPMRPKPAKREEVDEMRRFVVDDFLRILREDPDMPTETLAAKLDLTDANLYYHARRHGGVAALRERARAMAGAVPVATPPAPMVEPDPAPAVNAQAESVDDSSPAVDAAPAFDAGGVGPAVEQAEPPTPPRVAPVAAVMAEMAGPPETGADGLLLAGAMQGAEMMKTLSDPGEAPGLEAEFSADPAISPRNVETNCRHLHTIQGDIPLGELQTALSGLSALIGEETEVEFSVGVEIRTTWRQQRTTLLSVLAWWFGVRHWEQVHEIEGRMPIHRVLALVIALTGLLGRDAEVGAAMRTVQKVAS